MTPAALLSPFQPGHTSSSLCATTSRPPYPAPASSRPASTARWHQDATNAAVDGADAAICQSARVAPGESPTGWRWRRACGCVVGRPSQWRRAASDRFEAARSRSSTNCRLAAGRRFLRRRDSSGSCRERRSRPSPRLAATPRRRLTKRSGTSRSRAYSAWALANSKLVE